MIYNAELRLTYSDSADYEVAGEASGLTIAQAVSNLQGNVNEAILEERFPEALGHRFEGWWKRVLLLKEDWATVWVYEGQPQPIDEFDFGDSPFKDKHERDLNLPNLRMYSED